VKDRTFIGVASLAVGLLVLYVLSPPFVAWTFIKLGLDGSQPYVLQILYAPLEMLYENFVPYKALMDALFKVLVP